ncbi:MAG: PEP-CTERM sorting domain-containing protein [Phycisphaerae bacterium]|jgi:hypothetical protein
MMKREYICGIGLAFLIAVLFSPVLALGQVVTIGWQVSGSGLQSGTIETDLDWDEIYANPDTIYTWDLENPIEVVLAAGNVATIDGLSIGVEADPRITFGFAATAGTTNTHFVFTSNVLPVSPALFNAQGSASASVTFGDPGDSLTGNFGTKAYRSIYNGSQIFADLIDTPAYYPSGSGFVGSTPIAGVVTSMQAMWDVTVSAGGSASGSSRFTILGDVIPEPATMSLLGLGGLALLRKRRA